jgi:uncharacterized cupredoxin-like copper-binding protein
MPARMLTAAIVVVLASLLMVPIAPAATTAATVTVTMKEFKFALSKTTVKHGAVVFKLVNKGALPHDFKIGGKKSALIKPGKTGTLTVVLGKGNKPYLCTVPGHAAAGMKGVLKVT